VSEQDQLGALKVDLQARVERVDLASPQAREHYLLTLVVAQAAWDWTASRDEGHEWLLVTAIHQLRRYELRAGQPMLVHPMTRGGSG